METVFRSDDILLTSYLLTQQINLIDVVEDRPHHFVFLLSNTDKCGELKRNFLNNAIAPARELFSKREMLISEIKSRDRNKERYGKQ